MPPVFYVFPSINVPRAENLHPNAIAGDKTFPLQRLDRDRLPFHVTLEFGHVYNVVLLAEEILEAPFRQPPIKGHLTPLESGTALGTGTGPVTFRPPPGGSPVTGGIAPTDDFAPFLGPFRWPQISEFGWLLHYLYLSWVEYNLPLCNFDPWQSAKL